MKVLPNNRLIAVGRLFLYPDYNKQKYNQLQSYFAHYFILSETDRHRSDYQGRIDFSITCNEYIINCVTVQ